MTGSSSLLFTYTKIKMEVIVYMTEWAIAGIVVSILGGGWAVVRAVAGIVQPLTEQMTKLNDSICSLTKDLNELTERNSKTHARLFGALEEQDHKLMEHEIRIVRLEERGDKE